MHIKHSFSAAVIDMPQMPAAYKMLLSVMVSYHNYAYNFETIIFAVRPHTFFFEWEVFPDVAFPSDMLMYE